MTVEGNSNIAAIQSLRGIAAFMVVAFHLAGQAERLGLPQVDVTRLAAGVDIFFVISGFIMWITTAARPSRGATDFYRDRLIRIVPLYWSITAFIVAVLIISPTSTQTATLEPWHALSSFLFIPSTNPSTGDMTPLLIPGWTLNYEMLFYLLFGLSIAVSRGDLKFRAVIIFSSLAMLVVIGQVTQPSGIFWFYTRDIMLEFAFGVVLGIVYARGLIRPSSWWWVAAILGVLLLAAFPQHANELRSLKWGIPALLIVAGCVFSRGLALPPLERLGDWSYSLYLSHPLVLSAASQGWRYLGGPLPVELFPAVAVLACLIVSAALYNFLEIPSKNALRRKFSGARLAKPLAVT